jgi:proteasome lid subunit RPN8/RPN11
MSEKETGTSSRKIRINSSLLEEMTAYAESCLPNESCGLVAGKKDGSAKIVERVYKLSNADASGVHFTIDPREHLAAIKDMRQRGLTPLGNFHSHPQTPARPSEEDIKLAFDPDASYIIVSLAEDKPAVGSFHIENGAVSREDIETRE